MKLRILLHIIVLSFCLLESCYGNVSDWFESPPTPSPAITNSFCNSRVTKEGLFTNDSKISVQCVCTDKSVDCSTLKLQSLPEKIYFSNGIHLVNFRDNALKDIKDNTFYSGRDVTELDLSNNEIDFISLHSFKAFPNLRRLILSHNELFNLPYDMFDGLTNLRALDLSYNSVKTLLPHLFEFLPELRELKLEDNPLHELDPKLFEHLGKLEILDLESIIINNISDFTFSFTPNLKILILADNQLQQVPSVALKYLKNLRTLDLSGNPISEIEQGAFKGLESLTRLRLDRMPVLTRIKTHAFSNLTKLRELQCSYNFFLTDIEDDVFDSRNNKVAIDQISLRQNNLASIPSDLFLRSNPVTMHVDGNSFTCDCKFRPLLRANLKNDVSSQIRCSNPSHVKGQLLSSLKEDDLICHNLSSSDTLLLACLATVAVLISITVAGCFLYKKRMIRENPSYFQVFKKTDADEVVYDRSFRP